MKFRVVIDTNVLVSAQLNPYGNEAVVLALALGPTGLFEWFVSEAILAEYTRVLHYKKFPISRTSTGRLLALIRDQVTKVEPSASVSESKHDPDNRFLECAEAAQADFLVTGNKRHFPAQWKSVRIAYSRELLEQLTNPGLNKPHGVQSERN